MPVSVTYRVSERVGIALNLRDIALMAMFWFGLG
ncbi:hypothetical protein ABIE41_001373 [Bosea sp. OAE506]|jgi:hypothetical protein